MAEKDIFGEFKPTQDGVKAFRATAGERGYIARGTAIELIRKHTKEDPTNPGKPFAKELRLAIIDELGLEDEQDMDRIQFFTAVGTPLDVFHGIDAWIEFVPEQGSPVMVTLDVTKDPERVAEKEERGKVDLVILEMPDPSQEENKFMEAVDGYAREVANRLGPSVRIMLKKKEQKAA